jgi:hypothetical protein
MDNQFQLLPQRINKAEKLASPITFEAREYLRDVQGAPLLSFWLYKQLYVDPQTGNAVFQHADGTIRHHGNRCRPRCCWVPCSLNSMAVSPTPFTYRDFDLSAFVSLSNTVTACSTLTNTS